MTTNNVKPNSSAMASVLAAARDLSDSGMIDKKTMHEYEELCAVPKLGAKDVVRIRHQMHVSQAFFAGRLNVSTSTVRQWESGDKRPGPIAAKLLSIVEKHGIAILE